MSAREPLVVSIDEALERLGSFAAVIDARSPGEYAEDHLPGAINLPVLDDAQRAQVGTIDRQISAFEARRIGAAMVCSNIAGILSGLLADKPREFNPLVYCWRGGNRSGALATVLARTGWRTTVLEGGYRAYRRRVLQDLATLPEQFNYIVVAGRTGSGKSQILRDAGQLGAQVLDLEELAEHRGSVLGPIPGCPQPSQKAFESRIWSALRAMDQRRPVLVESESRKVGQCHLPDALMARMRAAPCRVISVPLELRVALLRREYAHFVADPAALCERLGRLSDLHSGPVMAHWLELAQSGDWDRLVELLLTEHYDPAYDRSMKRNFSTLATALTIEVPLPAAVADRPGALDAALASAARDLLASITDPAAP